MVAKSCKFIKIPGLLKNIAISLVRYRHPVIFKVMQNRLTMEGLIELIFEEVESTG